MLDLRERASVLTLLFLGLLALEAHGAKKACHLHLVYENPSYFAPNATATESQRFLYFLRDLKSLGMEFSSADQKTVLSEFKVKSSLNLKEMIANYKIWLRENNRQVHEPKGPSSELILWKDYFSPEGGQSYPFLPTDEATLAATKSHSDNLWSTSIRGLGGVLFNFGAVGKSARDFLNDVEGHGTARVILSESFQTQWIYALPLPGDAKIHVNGIDHRFFRFLSVFAPDLAGEFFEDLIPYLKSEMSFREFLSGMGLFEAGAFNMDAGGLKVLERWRARLSSVLLSLEDAAYLLSFVSAQQTLPAPFSIADIPMDSISNLTVVVSGNLSDKEFLIKEQAFLPPVVNKSWTSQGWRTRPGPRGTPNMTGDDNLIPNGPDL